MNTNDIQKLNKTYGALAQELVFGLLGSVAIAAVIHNIANTQILPKLIENGFTFITFQSLNNIPGIACSFLLGALLLKCTNSINETFGKFCATLTTSATCSVAWCYLDNKIPAIIGLSTIALNVIISGYEKGSLTCGLKQTASSMGLY